MSADKKETVTSLQTDTTETPVLDMLRDALRLGAYAVEKGRLPDEVSMGELHRMRNQISNGGGPLSDRDVNQMSYAYGRLEKELTPVTAVSLAATDCHGARDCMKTEAGRHARRLWLIAFSVVLLIIGLKMVRYTYEFYAADWATTWPAGFAAMTFLYWVAVNLIPFTYGALGSCVHVLRMTEKHLRQRTFEPRRIAQHRNRLVLGTLCGGAIVMFVTTGNGTDTTLNLTAAALGFLAGYSVDFLFAVLDRILSAVVPQEAEQDVGRPKLAGAMPQQFVAVASESKRPMDASHAKPERAVIEKALQRTAPAAKPDEVHRASVN